MNRKKPTTIRPRTTTDDTPDFDRNKVSLDVPDELFGNSFTLVTNISKYAGEFIMVNAINFLFGFNGPVTLEFIGHIDTRGL